LNGIKINHLTLKIVPKPSFLSSYFS